jgi:hypothetical protein
LKDAHRRAKIYAVSVFASLVLLAVVVETLKRTAGPPGYVGVRFDFVRVVCYGIAIVLVFVANVLHGFVLKGTRTSDIYRLASRLSVVTFIGLALAEVPVVLGFVMYVAWRSATDFYMLAFVSLYLMVRHFPYYRQWEELARERMGEAWPSGPAAR